MNNSTQVKMVVCGVAFVALSSIAPAPASAQEGGGCTVTPGEGIEVALCLFDPNQPQPVTRRADYDGNHSFKAIVFVRQKFWLQIVSNSTSDFFEQSRYPPNTPPLGPETCIPYVFATSFALGGCTRYDVTGRKPDPITGLPGATIDPTDEPTYVSFPIHYRVAWDHPTLTEFSGAFDNPRGLRAQTSTSNYFDLTAAVFPKLVSKADPGDDIPADGMSQYIIVQQPHANPSFACMEPLDCTRPSDPTANVFKAGRTIPVKVVLGNSTPQADLRLSFEDPSGMPHLAESSGHSNQGNMFRHTGSHFQFNWSTRGLAPGIYTLTIAPGTGSGSLFAPKTILVTLQ